MAYFTYILESQVLVGVSFQQANAEGGFAEIGQLCKQSCQENELLFSTVCCIWVIPVFIRTDRTLHCGNDWKTAKMGSMVTVQLWPDIAALDWPGIARFGLHLYIILTVVLVLFAVLLGYWNCFSGRFYYDLSLSLRNTNTGSSRPVV